MAETKESGPDPSNWLRAGFVALALLGLGLEIGSHALIDPDEGRNAVIAREMAVSGELLIPTLNGLPFLDKPFLFFAVEASALRIFGFSEFAARLPSLIFALATALLTAWLANRFFGRGTAFIAGLAAVTMPLALAMASVAIFDSMLAFFVVLALAAFYLAIEARRESSLASSRSWTICAWLAMAAGMLIKGPVALAVPLLVAVPFALWRRANAAVWHPFGWGLHLAIVLPAAWAIEMRSPGFLHYALVTETWRRLTTDEFQRTGPAWYFVPYLLGGAFPWVWVALVGGWARLRETAERQWNRSFLVFLMLWVAVPFVFFSLSQSKRPHYILPLLPAVALLAAWSWQSLPARRLAIRAVALGWLLLAAILLLGAAGILPGPRHATPEVTALIRRTAATLGLLTLAGGGGAWLLAHRRRHDQGGELTFSALCLPLVLLPLVSAPLLGTIAEERSGKALASALRPLLTPETQIVGVESFSPSLLFYLDRPIFLSSQEAEPMGCNSIRHFYDELLVDASTSLRPAGWWQETLQDCSRPRIYLIEPQYVAERNALEGAALPLIFENRKLSAFGPCAPEKVARRNEAARM